MAPGPSSADTALPPGERLLLLDVVRGIALLGILVMNMPAFTAAAPSAHGWMQAVDHGAEVLRDMLFAGKFNSMFSMLFGLGFMLQLDRLQRRHGDAAQAIYLRRLAWLLGVGLLHAVLVWNGDVLHMYALLGFTLPWLRRWPDRALVALMLLCMLGPALSQLARGLLAHGGAAAAAPLVQPAYTWNEVEIRAYGLGSVGDAVRQTMHGFVDLYTDPQELRHHLGFYAQVVTTMVLGLLIGRHGWLQRIPALMPRIIRIQQWSLGLGLVCSVVYGIGHDLSGGGSPLAKGLVGTCYVLARLALMSFYVLTLVRALQSPVWQRRLAPFAATGRMPLTNYLLQTVLCSVLFYGWGFGWWNRVGPAAELLIAPAMFLLIQLPLSLWWLRHHEQGPLEWLWRRATYGRAMGAARSK